MAKEQTGKELKEEVGNTTSSPSVEVVETPVKEYKKYERPVSDTPELDKIVGKYMLKKYKKTHLTEIDSNHVGAIMFDRTHHDIQASRKGTLTLTGLNKAQQAEFETVMNLAPGTLSPYNFDFWGGKDGKTLNEAKKGFSIQLTKEGTLIDCDTIIEHKLAFCFMKAESETQFPKFSIGLAAAALNPFCEYVLVSKEAEAKVNSKNFITKQKAYQKAAELSFEDQIEFLSVYEEGKYKVSKDSTADFVNEAFGRVVDSEPQRFLDTLADPLYKQFIFLGKAHKANVIRKQGAKYLTMDGDLIGNTRTEAAVNLSLPEYNSVKLSILTKLEAQK